MDITQYQFNLKENNIMATKRFTDAEKWKDPFFENLSNDMKIVWIYLLDDCDNAGIWKISMKRLNFHCNTNLTENNLLEIFSERIFKIKNDTYIIPKFIVFQNGPEWMNKNSAPVNSVKKKLTELGIFVDGELSVELDKSLDTLIKQLPNSINTVSIELDNSIDTTKGKDKDKDKSIDKDLSKGMGKDKDISKTKDEYNITDSNKNIAQKIIDTLSSYNLSEKEYINAFEDLKDLGGFDGISRILQWTPEVTEKYINHINNIMNSVLV